MSKDNYRRIGDCIKLVHERNSDLKDIVLLGLTINKLFIPSVANTIGTDMANYKLIKKNQFACSTMQVRRDKKMPIAMLQDVDEAMISQAYPIFEIIDTNELLPEYLMIWFSRQEFDREACFYAVGGVRGSIEWEDFCDMQLPLPSIETQRKIVAEYKAVQNRIDINNRLIQKLEETAQAIYREWFVEFEFPHENGQPYKSNGGEMVWREELRKVVPEGWRTGTIGDLCEYSNKRISINDLSLDTYISTENMLQNRGGIVQANNLPTSGSVTNFEIGNILISNIRPYFKKIWLANFNGGCSNDVLCFSPRRNVPPLYLYQILEKDNFFDYVMAGSKGTKMPRGDKKWMMNYNTVIPSNELLEKFSRTTQVFQKDIQIKKLENQKLTELKDLLLSRLAAINY